MNIDTAVKTTGEMFLEVFGVTPFSERLEDILGEARELSRTKTLKETKDETGDVLASVLALIHESGWSAEELLNENAAKIRSRKWQYQTMGRRKSVVIFGGSFDPITKGHIEVAETVLKTLSNEIDEVCFMPCCGHLEKSHTRKQVPVANRIEMISKAIEHNPKLKVSTLEADLRTQGRTKCLISAMEALPDYSDKRVYHLIGMDVAKSLPSWGDDLESRATFIVVNRGGQKLEGDEWFLKKPHLFLEMDVEASSTKLKQDIIDGDFSLVPDAIIDQVKTNYL